MPPVYIRLRYCLELFGIITVRHFLASGNNKGEIRMLSKA